MRWLTAVARQYISPHRNVYIPVTHGFTYRELDHGTKMASVLQASVLAPILPGHSVHITDQSENQTFTARVTDADSIESAKLFLQEGGDAVAQDEKGNVDLAAREVLVYGPVSKLVRTIDAPERPVDFVFGDKDRRTPCILLHRPLCMVEMRDAGL